MFDADSAMPLAFTTSVTITNHQSPAYPAYPDQVGKLVGVTKSFPFTFFHTLLRFFAPAKNSTLFIHFRTLS